MAKDNDQTADSAEGKSCTTADLTKLSLPTALKPKDDGIQVSIH